MLRTLPLLTGSALLISGCELPTSFDENDFSSIESTFRPGEVSTLTLKTGWILRVDASGAPEPYHVVFRDTPRRDWPSNPSASGVEVIYHATTGRTEPSPAGVEVRFQLSRTLDSSFVPRTGRFGFVTAPPPANVFGFLPGTCALVEGARGRRVRLSATFQVGPHVGGEEGPQGFGTRAHLGIAPFLFREEHLPVCRPAQG